MRLLILAAAALVLAASSSQAVVLQPGTYKLEWVIPGPDEETSPFGRRSASLEMMDEERAARMKGLVSDRAFAAVADGYLIVIDESGGSSKGYDTAYVIPEYTEGQEVDLSLAPKLALLDEGGSLRSDPASDVRVDVSLGDEGSRITKQAALTVEVYWHQTENQRPISGFALLSRRGGWKGKVSTDTGSIDVSLYDMNGNGVYGDRISVEKGVSADRYPRLGDALELGSFPEDIEDYGAMVYLSRVNLYKSRLYVFDLSSTGETLEIAAYTGDTGTLSTRAKDGVGKAAECPIAMVYGESGMYFISDADVKLPPGDYACTMAQVIPKQDVDEDKRFGLTVRAKSTVRVAKDGRGVLEVGGPISLQVDPKSEVVRVKRGESKNIDIAFSVGGHALTGVMGDRKATVNIRDARGKLLSSSQSGFG